MYFIMKIEFIFLKQSLIRNYPGLNVEVEVEEGMAKPFSSRIGLKSPESPESNKSAPLSISSSPSLASKLQLFKCDINSVMSVNGLLHTGQCLVAFSLGNGGGGAVTVFVVVPEVIVCGFLGRFSVVISGGIIFFRFLDKIGSRIVSLSFSMLISFRKSVK